MGKLIIHLGPPKTASTSLQYFLQRNEHLGYKYIGIVQPKEEITLGARISEYLLAIQRDFKTEHKLSKEIAEITIANNITILSSEYIVVPRNNIPIRINLEKIFRIVSNENVIITFAIREATSSYFSYYIEMYNHLTLKCQKSFEEFQKSEYGDCYKYEKMIKMMRLIGFKSFNFFEYDKLIKGELCVNEILGTNEQKWEAKINLPKKNITNKKNPALKVQRQSKLKSIISKFTPVFLQGFGLGTHVFKLPIMKTDLKLNKIDVLNETKNIHKSDMIYLRSLNNKK